MQLNKASYSPQDINAITKHLQKECYDDLLKFIGLPVRNSRDQYFNWIDVLDQSFSSLLTFDNQRCKTIFSYFSLLLRLGSTFKCHAIKDFVTWLLLWDSDSDGCDIEAPMVELEVPIGWGC